MLIKSLSDNISLNEKFLHEHGLSIYFEINNIKVLFDTVPQVFLVIML